MNYLDQSVLFQKIDRKDLKNKLEKYGALEKEYKKDSYIFEQGGIPESLYVLISGSVAVSNIEVDGKRSIVNIFKDRGTVFGEVYIFLEERPYDYSCIVLKDARILEIPKKVFIDYKNWEDPTVRIMVRNMLDVLSRKAFYLNNKNLILSGLTLGQKLYRFFQQNEVDGKVQMKYNREELADYLGTTRPSVSRELSKLQKEGRIDIQGSVIKILKGDDEE